MNFHYGKFFAMLEFPKYEMLKQMDKILENK